MTFIFFQIFYHVMIACSLILKFKIQSYNKNYKGNKNLILKTTIHCLTP